MLVKKSGETFSIGRKQTEHFISLCSMCMFLDKGGAASLNCSLHVPFNCTWGESRIVLHNLVQDQFKLLGLDMKLPSGSSSNSSGMGWGALCRLQTTTEVAVSNLPGKDKKGPFCLSVSVRSTLELIRGCTSGGVHVPCIYTHAR